MIRFSDTCSAIKADCLRLQTHKDSRLPLTRRRCLRLALQPEMLPLLLYRISHYFHSRGRHSLAGLTYRVNLLLTGSDIHPASQIGAGCLMPQPSGLVIAATIGANASLHAAVIIAAETSLMNLKNAPRLGDNITVHKGATILGGVEIASNFSIAPHSLVQQSLLEQGGFFQSDSLRKTNIAV